MTALRTVAVGFDGSADAEAAVRWAFDLAVQVDVDVVLVHAVGLLEHVRRRDFVIDLEKSVQRLTVECGLDPARVRLRVIDGDACSVLLRVADAPIAADLLVVGSRGLGAHAGQLLGSTSLELVEHSAIPLVVVPNRPDGS